MKARRKLVRKPKPAPKKAVREASREETRRFASRVSSVLLIVGAIVGLVLVANRWSAREGIRKIRIVGRQILDSTEIASRAAIPAGTSIERLDLDAVERRLASHPFIARASVYRGENGTLVMEIAERAPVAVTFIDGAPVYLDSSGVALPYRFSSAGFDVPVIGGISAPAAVRDSGSTVPAIRIDTLKAREALGVAAAIRSYDEGLFRQISEIRREPDGEYTLMTADGAVPIRAGDAAGIGSRLAKLDLFLSSAFNAEGAARAAYIDLRWEGEVVVRWRGGDAGEAAG
jgi:cell division septal protein FtsQ